MRFLFQAVSSAAIKLVLWHWSQPLVYLWMLFPYRCYIASLGEWQPRFAAVVAVREVLYLGSTVLATWQCPVFLLMDPVTAWKEAKGRLERVQRAAMWVLTPHNYTALCLANRFPDWRRTFLGLAAIHVQVRCNSAAGGRIFITLDCQLLSAVTAPVLLCWQVVADLSSCFALAALIAGAIEKKQAEVRVCTLFTQTGYGQTAVDLCPSKMYR